MSGIKYHHEVRRYKYIRKESDAKPKSIGGALTDDTSQNFAHEGSKNHLEPRNLGLIDSLTYLSSFIRQRYQSEFRSNMNGRIRNINEPVFQLVDLVQTNTQTNVWDYAIAILGFYLIGNGKRSWFVELTCWNRDCILDSYHSKHCSIADKLFVCSFVQENFVF